MIWIILTYFWSQNLVRGPFESNQDLRWTWRRWTDWHLLKLYLVLTSVRAMFIWLGHWRSSRKASVFKADVMLRKLSALICVVSFCTTHSTQVPDGLECPLYHISYKQSFLHLCVVFFLHLKVIEKLNLLHRNCMLLRLYEPSTIKLMHVYVAT